MGQFPFAFERINETTWAYLSSFLMIALFFKFNRFWSIRNLDLLLIILLAPGILMVHVGQRWQNSDEQKQSTSIPESTDTEKDPSFVPAEKAENLNESESASDKSSPDKEKGSGTTQDSADEALATPTAGFILLQQGGYYWLFFIGALFLIRLLLDNALVRRPILESNLTISGLVFLGCTLMVFLFLNVVNSTPSLEDLNGAQSAVKLLQREAAGENDVDQLIQRGPGYTLISVLPIIPSFGGDEVLEADLSKEDLSKANLNKDRNINRYILAAKSLAISSQFAIVLGLILIGYWHFNSFRSGVEAATIYLILPYTAVYMGHAMHSLPAALMVWAIVYFKRPFLAGIFLGLAIGVSYYPLFLLALWISFYWEKGKKPFIYGVLLSLAICAAGLLFTSANYDQFITQLQRMLGAFAPLMENLAGIWGLGWDYSFRMPLLAAFIVFSASFAFWPIRKNIGTLISCTAAIMVALQFWHGFGGGTYLAYYMPLALLIFLRPNVDGRDALSEISRAENDRNHKLEANADILPDE